MKTKTKTKTKADPVAIPTNPNDGMHEIIAIGGSCWSRDVDAASARKGLLKLTSAKAHRYVVVPKGAMLDECGFNITWPTSSGHGDMRCDHCTF